MAPQTFQLVMRSGPNPGKTFELDKNELTIGRDITNDIVINDPEISRHHARLLAQAGGFVIEDTGSTNGTFVDGQRLMGPHLLRLGELILLGENISLGFEAPQYDADATMVASSGIPSMPPVEPSPVAPPPFAAAPPPRQTYTPPPQPRPQPPVAPPVGPPLQPAYSGAVPPGPAYEMPEEEPRRSRTWLYVGCGCLVILLCIVVVGAFAFDYFNLYCTPPFNGIFPCS